MKIAIPTDDTIAVSEHFGRAAFFAITDTEKHEMEHGAESATKIVRNENSGGGHHNHSHAHEHSHHDHHADRIAELLNGADGVVTSHMGKPMIERLLDSGKSIYIVPLGKTIAEAVQLFVEGKAKQIRKS
ncbi:MAG: hypothetical protein KGJ59_14510 [Bacteroidota bacterium]|nr:hypothetical protein [Bacteroidota bacterium]